MSRKISVAILFGGDSSEHEISLLSAKNVFDALDRDKYTPILIGIDKNGEWYLREESQFLLTADAATVRLAPSKKSVALAAQSCGRRLLFLNTASGQRAVDVVFPVLHGINGEDGTVQGLLQLAGVPYVGAGVLGSAIGMDKEVMKRLLRESKLPTARFVAARDQAVDFQSVVEAVGLPFFVKPANAGSSVGIAKICSEQEFRPGVDMAFAYDRKILFEECITGREIECSVLGNDTPLASLPGEVIPQHAFYSYEAKFLDPKGALFAIPAPLSPAMTQKVQQMAIEVFTTLCCEGMGRVDFFLTEQEQLYVNEINTIPGFTKISLYPKLWEISGLPLPQLVDRLIELAIERFEKNRRLARFCTLSGAFSP